MNARDELRGTLCNTVCNASNYTKRAQPYLLGSDMSVVLDKTADAILAAGYRKPRTITNAEELDALRTIGTAIEWGGKVYGAELAVPGDRPYWFGPGRATATTITPSADYPATVLHDPEAAA